MNTVLSATIATLLAFTVAPARATDSRDYAKGEYAIIRDGRSPDKRFSLAAHGDGEGGAKNFRIWLMAEPAHRRIAALDGIGSGNNLDTGAGAYRAVWSDDSRRVGIYFRGDRHVIELKLYELQNRRPQLILGPALFNYLTGREVADGNDMRHSVVDLTWKGPNRFVLRERRVFVTSDPALQRLGGYGRTTAEKGEDRPLVEFSAEADCELKPGNRYAITDLRFGQFGEPGQW